MSKAPGDASSGSADPVATDALRRHVCRVLGVEVHAEGEKLVPSDGTGSITRLDWTRVDAVLGGADEKTSEGADDADAAAEGADDSASREETPRQPRGADDEDTVASVAEDADEDAVAASRGRVGPMRVEIDRTYAVGDVRVDAAGTSAQSRANFSSLRANACVFEGKWSYEATLGSSGIMQLGWCTTRCPFTRENGVGDAPDSFAFDGHRVRKWNVSSQPYGKAWVAGDVITCTIDLNPGPEGGTVSYHRNGVPLGVAFDNVRRWRDVERAADGAAAASAFAYFPAVSLSMDERVALNFGDAPARYPVEGYAPLQAPPDEATVLTPAERGLRVFEALAAPPEFPGAPSGKGGAVGRPLFLRFEEETLMAATALRRAGPALASPATRRYITRGCLIPAIRRAAANSDALPEEAAAGAAAAGAAASSSPFLTPPLASPPGRVDAYARAVALLCAALSPEELAAVVPELMAALAELARSAPLAVLDRRAGSAAESPSGPSGFRARAPAELPRLASHAPLACAAALARIPAARRAWLARRGWGSAAEGLLTRRIPNADDLAVMLPARAACWPGAAATEARFAPSGSSSYPGSPESESLCSSAGRALGEAMLRTQTLHAVLFRALVDPEPDAAFTPAEPGTTEDDAPTDFLVSALAEARRASAATAAATAASAAAGDPTAARRDQSFDADLDPDDEADFMASPAGSPAPRDSRRSRSEEEIADDGWPRERCRRSPLLVLLTWLASKNKNAGSNQMAQLTRNGRSARTGHSDPTVLASAYFATLSVLHPALEAPGGTPLAAPPTSLFHDSLAHQLDLPLFGGGANHVSKTYPPAFGAGEGGDGGDDARELRVDPADVRAEGAAPSAAALGEARAPRTLRAVGVSSGFALPLEEARAFGVLPVTRLWDITQLLYHLGVGYHFKAAAYQLQTQIQAAQHLEDASRRLEVAERCSREAAEWQKREGGPAEGGFAENERDGASEDGRDVSTFPRRGPPDASGSVPPARANAAPPGDAPPGDDLLAKLRDARRSLRDEVVEAARLCWWHRAVLHRPDQQAAMFAAAAYGAALLLSAMARRDGAPGSRARSRAASVSDIADSVDAEASIEDQTLLGGVGAEAREHFGGAAFASREEEASGAETRSEDSRSDDSSGSDPEKNRGALLPHVPAYHLESLIDSFHALRRGDPPFSPGTADAHTPGLHSVVRLLVRHFHDDRVVNPDIRDAMLQSISVLLQYREYVDVFERNEEARDAMVPALLKAFDSRFWIPVSNILLRLCRGAGFGQQHERDSSVDSSVETDDAGTDTDGGSDARHAASAASAAADGPDASLARALASPQPEGASPLFQRLLVDCCRSDPSLLAEFLDRLFNTLNWTVTEFGVTLKEALDSRARQHETRQRRRKCTVMFELSVTLTRVLEFLTKELPEVFLEAQSLDLRRLTETLVFVLGHATVGPDAALFDRALLAHVAPSDKVSRAAILAPVAGILLNLDTAASEAAERLEACVESKCVESIAAELARSNADVAQLEFLGEFSWTDHFFFPAETPGESKESKSTPRVLTQLRDFVRRVCATREDVERARETEDARSIPDAFVDPIMQTVMTDPVTLPGSGQVVDRATIRRHLLGDRTDPFSRSPLDESMLVPADELRRSIEKWREEAPAAESLADID